MFAFRQSSSLIGLPSGFFLEDKQTPSALALNRLLSSCREPTFAPERLTKALEKSFFCLSIFDESDGVLVGFVRATSDHGLNANLWNLVAKPGAHQHQFLSVLVHRALGRLRRELPGCSVSVSAPVITVKALQAQGFLLDPNGIRAMGLRLT